MKTFRKICSFALPHRSLSSLIGALLFGSLSAGALPKLGTPAPPLQFTKLLQAPPDARTDWDGLRGKVVVLEFWETMCAPCVAEIPHLNKLVAELDPAKFQFISVDGFEELNVVEKFLAKKKMAGWIGIATPISTFALYGVKEMPTTIIVNGQGKIVAVTRPEELATDKLLAVSEGKSVKFMPTMEMPPSFSTSTPTGSDKDLYQVSLSKSAPDEQQKMSTTTGPTGRMDMFAQDVKSLIGWAYDIPQGRILHKSPLPEKRYNLHFAWSTGEVNDSLIMPFLQSAIKFGLNLQIQPKTVVRKSYVLKATAASAKLLTPTASTGGSMSGYWKGKLKVVNQSMDSLATSLESALETPVINETGIEGKFDAEVEFPAKDADAAKTALLKTLGLKLIQADRPIQMFEVSSGYDSKKKEEPKLQASPKP
jgi:uncharacterized protein (TIGR03435 family)